MDNTFNNGKIYCTKCGTANKAGYRFCVKCGTKLMTPAARTQAEDVQEILKTEPVKVEPVRVEPEQPMFSAFNGAAPAAEPERHTLQPTFDAFEEAAPAEEPVKAEAEPERHTLQPTFDAFEEAAPKEEEPVRIEESAGNDRAAFEAEPKRDYSGFARSGFAGATTATAAAGAFATAVDAVKNKKQIDVSDAETVMSLLEQGEPSALAKGLPAWDIVPPQVVVRRKRRV